MVDKLEKLKKRFGKNADEGSQRRRRKDYKGIRQPLNLRVGGELMEALRIIRTAGGEEQNAFCERVLMKAAEERMGELKREFDDGAWAIILRCARAKAEESVAD